MCEAQPHPVAVRRADALERIAETYLASQSGDRSGGDRYMVHIHTEADTLKADGKSAESELEEHVDAFQRKRHEGWPVILRW